MPHDRMRFFFFFWVSGRMRIDTHIEWSIMSPSTTSFLARDSIALLWIKIGNLSFYSKTNKNIENIWHNNFHLKIQYLDK